MKYNKQKTSYKMMGNPNWRGGKISKICPTCKKIFEVKISGKNKRIYCSYKCIRRTDRQKDLIRKSRLGIFIGKKCGAWKGGKTPLGIKIRGSDRYKQWRQDIFIRDNFTCKICSQVGGKLEAHHIKLFSILMQEAKEYMPLIDWYEACMLYTPLWNTNNGITYCYKCHDKIDWRKK